MNTQDDVRGFLAEKTLAIAGISRDEKSYSRSTYKKLSSKGYLVLLVNPNAGEIEGETCYPSLTALPRKVGGVILFTPPAETEKVVREAAGLGIKRLWIQQGAESDAALQFCREKGLAVVSGQCILMFPEPAAFRPSGGQA
jgi:predicted CoA-binding protein